MEYNQAMTPQPSATSLRGKWMLLAMAALAAVLAGWLYWIAASDTSAEYRQSKPGAPADPVRVAMVDMQWESGIQAAVDSLRQAQPDIILVQHITRGSLVAIVKALDMARPQYLFYSELSNSAQTSGGCGIISRYQLYRHRELRDGTRDTFAVAAEVVVSGRRFLLISTAIGGPNMPEQSEVLRKTTGLLRIGPLVCAGQLGPTPPQGLHVLGSHGGDGLYVSKHWRMQASGGMGKIMWVEITAARTN